MTYALNHVSYAHLDDALKDARKPGTHTLVAHNGNGWAGEAMFIDGRTVAATGSLHYLANNKNPPRFSDDDMKKADTHLKAAAQHLANAVEQMQSGKLRDIMAAALGETMAARKHIGSVQ